MSSQFADKKTQAIPSTVHKKGKINTRLREPPMMKAMPHHTIIKRQLKFQISMSPKGGHRARLFQISVLMTALDQDQSQALEKPCPPPP